MSHVAQYIKFGTYHGKYTSKVLELYLKKMNIPKIEPFSVMDIGCGDGNVLNQHLLPRLPDNCKEIIATDIDADMISFCKHNKTIKPVSFLQMDAATWDLPDCLKDRFDAIFSFLCFMYVRNLKQGLLNCRTMLKKDRDLLMCFFSSKNLVFHTYVGLSKMDAWKPYLKDFSSFKPHLSNGNPLEEAKTLFEDVGLKLLDIKNEVVEFQSNRRNFLEVHNAMDFVFRRLPDGKKMLYKKDFARILSDIIDLDLVDESKLDTPASMFIPVITLHGRKL